MKHTTIDLSKQRLLIEMTPHRLRNLEINLEEDLKHYADHLPQRSVIAWHAYLACMIEWGILVFAEYRQITARLPAYPADPVDRTLMGRVIRYRHPGEEVTPAELEALATKTKAVFDQGDVLPTDTITVAWHAYLSPLQVYGVITLAQYRELKALLPPLEGEDPIDAIVLGRD